MSQFISGAITMGYLVAGLYFLRYWKETRDRLFAFLALAFGTLAVQRFALALAEERSEGHTFLYVIRLLAFVIILLAIADKNRPGKAKRTAQ